VNLVLYKGFIGSFRHFSGCAASGCSSAGESSTSPLRAVQVRDRQPGGSRIRDLLVVRWMKDRLLRYEIAEDLGGEPGGRG